MWDIFSNTEVTELTEVSDEARVTSMTYDPSGDFILTADNDGRANVLTLRDGRTGTPLRVYRGNQDVIREITFSPDGTHAISIANDGNVRVWDIFIEDASELNREEVRIPVIPSEDSRTPSIAINSTGDTIFLAKGSFL
ncbi:MAG: hypothetical protein AAF125_17135, partial [Chloroflexota bacterium]